MRCGLYFFVWKKVFFLVHPSAHVTSTINMFICKVQIYSTTYAGLSLPWSAPTQTSNVRVKELEGIEDRLVKVGGFGQCSFEEVAI